MIEAQEVVSCLAVRQPGGNRLDDIRINLPASYKIQDKWLADQKKKSICRSFMYNCQTRLFFSGLKRLGLFDTMVMTGVLHGWFDAFSNYWTQCLGGRPITVTDFHLLSYDYRKRFHANSKKNWESSAQHVANYQTPDNLFLTFSFAAREAVNPIRNHQLLSLLRPGLKILEFGCSLAPMYGTWRQFSSHKKCYWVLADIASFPFHYARHKYANDFEVNTCLITEDLFDDPLKNVESKFDIIIIQEVFEHLHKPLHIAKYLCNRLNKNGLLFFDYVKSDAQGLDTLAGLEERSATLEFLYSTLTPVCGSWQSIQDSLGICIGRKN
ncbi:MAG: methyltransferase type 12 [Proteobacteria bacterium]|nr:methyltransferase type 12 [Pseudomonadota bacterium]